MNVSTFTKWDRFKFVALFTFFALLLAYTRKFPLDVIALAPAAVVVFLVMRTRIQKHFAKTPIRQVAYVSLTEPVYDYYTANVGEDENGRPIMERRREKVGEKRRDTPLKKYIASCYVNFEEYISSKGNPLVMVCGLSGMGKSELTKVLLLRVVKAPKVVFSFKPNDTHLRLPYPVIDVSRHIPNPFQDADALSMAYALAFPANLRGIMLSEARAIVKNLAGESKDWNQFRANLKRMEKRATDIQREALALIEQQIESLAVGEGSFNMDLTKDVVLDFSHLDEAAKTFYAEIALRLIWNALTNKKMPPSQASLAYGMIPLARTNHEIPGKSTQRVAIVIDEVHRLTQLYGMDARTVLDTIMLEIRQFGTLLTATQNQTDIPDNLRQFGTELAFHTTIPKELEALSKIDPSYPWIVRHLQPYEFIDLSFRVGNEGLVPVFRVDMGSLPKTDVRRGEPVDVSREPRPQTPIDYGAIVREKIDSGEVVWVSRLASFLEEEHRIDSKDVAKLKLRNVLLKLLDAGDVQVQKFDDIKSGETVSLYFAKSINENEGPLHKWMLNQVVDGCRNDIIHIASTGEALPDIETTSKYVEVETGLKRRVDDLRERIAKFTAKPFVVLVPNTDVAQEYNKKLTNGKAIIMTIRDFLLEGQKQQD